MMDVMVDGLLVPYSIRNDQHDNLELSFNHGLTKQNQIKIRVSQMSSPLNLVEIVIDDIRFGLVTFLCTTIDGKQDTQLKRVGDIDVVVKSPIWQYWCDKMNDFSYERYPLGSIA